MNNIGIIIQKTKGEGLDFNIFPNSINLELTSKFNLPSEDERDTPGKVKDKDIFALQFSENFKIYSLIIGAKDGPRAGFYGIRIFIPINYNLDNFTSILYNIQSKFLLNSSSSENQIYDDILEIIKNSCSESNKFIVLNTSNNNHFCYYESNNSNAIEAIFNSNKTYLISKLYAFQKPKEEELRTEIAINNTIYKEIDVNNEIVEIKIIGDINYLKEVKINNISVKFNPNQSNLILLLNKKDKIEYTPLEKGCIEVNSSTKEIIVSRKKIIREEPNGYHPKPEKSFIDKHGTWLILILLATLIILIIQQEYFNNPDPEKEIEKPDTTIFPLPKITDPKIVTPKVQEPKIQEPKVQEPKVQEPKVEEPKGKVQNEKEQKEKERKEKEQKEKEQKEKETEDKLRVNIN